MYEVATLYRISDTELPPHRLAPTLGAQTDEILVTVGYSHGRIEALRARNAIG